MLPNEDSQVQDDHRRQAESEIKEINKSEEKAKEETDTQAQKCRAEGYRGGICPRVQEELITFRSGNVHTGDCRKWKCPHLLHGKQDQEFKADDFSA